MEKGLSAVLVVVVSAVVVIFLAVTLMLYVQGSSQMVSEFQMEADKCSNIGGKCVAPSKCESGFLINRKCEDLEIQHPTYSIGSKKFRTKKEIVKEKICCNKAGLKE